MYVYIGGRANSGTVVQFSVIDITEDVAGKTLSVIPIISRALTMTSTMAPTYVAAKIEAGRRYVIHSKLPSELIGIKGSAATSSALRIWTTTTTTDTSSAVDTVKQTLYRGSMFQDEFYEFVATGDASYVGFYARTTSSSISSPGSGLTTATASRGSPFTANTPS